MKCPECHKVRTMQTEETRGDRIVLVTVPALFYQRSEPGDPGHISKRCLKCYEKAERELEQNNRTVRHDN